MKVADVVSVLPISPLISFKCLCTAAPNVLLLPTVRIWIPFWESCPGCQNSLSAYTESQKGQDSCHLRCSSQTLTDYGRIILRSLATHHNPLMCDLYCFLWSLRGWAGTFFRILFDNTHPLLASLPSRSHVPSSYQFFLKMFPVKSLQHGFASDSTSGGSNLCHLILALLLGSKLSDRILELHYLLTRYRQESPCLR